MRHKGAFLQEFLSADCTRMWNATMDPAMVDQLEFARERRPTIGANERIQWTVETWMHDQVVFLCKAFAALIAYEWPFSGVEFTVRH